LLPAFSVGLMTEGTRLGPLPVRGAALVRVAAFG